LQSTNESNLIFYWSPQSHKFPSLDSEATQTLPVDTSLQAHSEPLKTSPTASPSIHIFWEFSYHKKDGKGDEERIEEEHDTHQEVNEPRPENNPPVESTEIEEEPPIQVI